MRIISNFPNKLESQIKNEMSRQHFLSSPLLPLFNCPSDAERKYREVLYKYYKKLLSCFNFVFAELRPGPVGVSACVFHTHTHITQMVLCRVNEMKRGQYSASFFCPTVSLFQSRPMSDEQSFFIFQFDIGVIR